mmetsp:Transcript_129542/g.242351  ORF Transcript_129542/g.242351 Transcript_129542/m.242351 type:complete len:741 (+) Transcript_129542:75-2297(+)
MALFSGSGAPAFQTVAEAAQAQNVDAVIDMLNSGYNVHAQDMDGNTALHWAAWFKLDGITQKLLDRAASPEMGNSSGESAVHWAAKSSNVNALNAMIKHDRGVLSQRDCDGFTPFIISAQNDNAPIMEWMYLKGVSVEEQDDWGRTALQWACYKGHRRTVQWLLSRSASVAHRDHEGMTAIHWAALKGHEQVAEMLLDVGAVQLLHVPDAAGDTPIALAMRKKNRYLVLCFHKCQLFQMLFGRPHISHNHFANLFILFNMVNIVVFAFVIAPGIVSDNLKAVIVWSVLMIVSLAFWGQNCLADPGWLQPRTIFPQHTLIGDDPTRTFDAEQPVESQMVHYDNLTEELVGDQGSSSSDLARLELEQNKFNYQRQLIAEARKRLNDGSGCCVPAYATAGTGGTELQPLMHPTDMGATDGMAPAAQQQQLERAALALRQRERMTGDSIGRARVKTLLHHGCGEYFSLVEKGDFKQVCVVCRARREMRSHHCKECGRCVQRLDHHCPWIDNCVGLGNQRSFYGFIVFLFITICYLYYVVGVYIADVIVPDWSHGFVPVMLEAITKASWGHELAPLLIMITAAFDLIWLAFVGALVARHTAYMSVNVTTYEVLVRPAHVQRRFPKNRGRFWFLNGFGLPDCIMNCINYWTLNTDHDAAAFLGTTPADSFVAPPVDDGSGDKLEKDFTGNSHSQYQLVHQNNNSQMPYNQEQPGGFGASYPHGHPGQVAPAGATVSRDGGWFRNPF